MAVDRQSGTIYEFGNFRLDPSERQLVRDGQLITIAPKVFDTLLALIEEPGRLVDKERLMSRLWPDTFVEEATLARNISDLRKALGGSASGQQFIETVPKRGYRFISEVRLIGSQGTDWIIERGVRSRVIVEEQPEETGISSIAVMPFRPISFEGRDEYLELGIADALITRLSNIGQLVVRSTNSVRKYVDIELEASQAGLQLQVGHILEGSIQRAGDRIRITARLVSVDDGRALWAGKFDVQFTDIFSVEDAISERVASALVVKLTGEEKRLMARRDTNDAEAHRRYLKGRYYWNKRTRQGYEKGIECFEQAIEIDQYYALAYAGLADCYSMLGRFGLVRPSEIMPKALSSAATALKLDDTLSESHCSMALATHIYAWELEKAEYHYKRGIDLNPRYATGHHWYGVLLAEAGRAAEALSQMSQAQSLDPVSLIIAADVAMVLYLARDYDRALEQCRDALDMDPNYFRARMWLGCVYEQQGSYDQAIAEYTTAGLLDDSPYVLEWLARAQALSGNDEAAHRTLVRLIELSSQVYIDGYYLAAVYAALRRENEALAVLETAFQDRSCWVSRLMIDPIFDKLRSEPGFENIVNIARRSRLHH